jgi:uncharacterized membrane protein
MGILTTLAQSGLYDDSGYSYSYSYSSSDLSPGAAAALFVFTFLIAIASYVVLALCLMRIFKKAGVAQWIAWVPFYNSWKALEIGGQQGFWAVLALVPFVNFVSFIFMIIAFYNIGLKLGKSGAFVLLAIFLPIVWYIWLAVDGSTWDDSKGAPRKDQVAPGTPTSTPPATPAA